MAPRSPAAALVPSPARLPCSAASRRLAHAPASAPLRCAHRWQARQPRLPPPGSSSSSCTTRRLFAPPPSHHTPEPALCLCRPLSGPCVERPGPPPQPPPLPALADGGILRPGLPRNRQGGDREEGATRRHRLQDDALRVLIQRSAASRRPPSPPRASTPHPASHPMASRHARQLPVDQAAGPPRQDPRAADVGGAGLARAGDAADGLAQEGRRLSRQQLRGLLGTAAGAHRSRGPRRRQCRGRRGERVRVGGDDLWSGSRLHSAPQRRLGGAAAPTWRRKASSRLRAALRTAEECPSRPGTAPIAARGAAVVVCQRRSSCALALLQVRRRRSGTAACSRWSSSSRPTFRTRHRTCTFSRPCSTRTSARWACPT